jgi:hypothetical protein
MINSFPRGYTRHLEEAITPPTFTPNSSNHFGKGDSPCLVDRNFIPNTRGDQQNVAETNPLPHDGCPRKAFPGSLDASMT